MASGGDDWGWYVVDFFLFGGGTWVANQGRRALVARRRAADRRHQRKLELAQAKKDASKGPEPICGCSHHLALHNPNTHVCNGEEMVRIPAQGTHGAREERRKCLCQQYVGPQPLATLYAPDLTDLDAP